MSEEKKKAILDLDEFLPPEKTIKIAGKEYRVKGDASVRSTLKLMQAAEKWGTEKTPTSITPMIEAIKEFFIDPIEGDILEALDVKQLPRLIGFLFDKEVGGENPKN